MNDEEAPVEEQERVALLPPIDADEREVDRDDDEGGDDDNDDDDDSADHGEDDEEQEGDEPGTSAFLELALIPAIQALRDSQEELLNRHLVVDVGRLSEEELPAEILPEASQRHRFWFRRFMDALGGNHRIPKLYIKNGNFRLDGARESDDVYMYAYFEGEVEDDDSDDEVSQQGDADLDLFFTSVLPNHPSLVEVDFCESRIHTRYLRLFAESIPSAPTTLLRLTLDLTPINRDCCSSIKQMLQRNATIEELSILHCCKDLDCWRLVCEGVAENNHIRMLHLMGELTVEPDTFAAAIGPRSRLRKLIVDATSWSEEAFAKFAEVMRTNTVLKHLFLCQQSTFPNMHQFEDMLRTYNFTLPSARLHPLEGTPHEERIDALLERNECVREFHEHLQARGYHVEDRSLWPAALRRVATFPTLVYRFVRIGNSDAFADHMASLHDKNSSAKKRRLG